MKKFALALLALLLPALPAHAFVVEGAGASDGVGAVPLGVGMAILDTRLNAVFPGNAVALPAVDVVAGINEGVEIGFGTGLSFSALGTPSDRMSIETLNPWVKAALPLSTDTLKTAVLLGATIPGYNAAPSTEFQPGVAALMDLATGALKTSVNAGYGRGLHSGTNLAAFNLNFTVPWAGLTWYEEQFVTYPVGQYATGGVRASMIVPLADGMSVDVNPAMLWTNASGGTTWAFAPNLGMQWAF